MYDKRVGVRDAANLYKASQAAWRNASETHVRVVYAVGQVCFLYTILP